MLKCDVCRRPGAVGRCLGHKVIRTQAARKEALALFENRCWGR